MYREKFFKRLALLILLIFLLNFSANNLYWYYAIWWFDMLMHFLGGLWVGLFTLYLLRPESLNNSLIFKVFLAVFMVGIGWEIFEFVFTNVVAGGPFHLPDTLSDIFFDLSGSVAALFYFSKKIMAQRENKIQSS